jgi:hypothetical protein
MFSLAAQSACQLLFSAPPEAVAGFGKGEWDFVSSATTIFYFGFAKNYATINMHTVKYKQSDFYWLK